MTQNNPQLMPILANPLCTIKTTESRLKRHDVYINGEIGSPHQYTDFLSLLEISDPNAVQFVIHINSVGGQMTTTVQLINAIKMSKCHTMTVLEHQANSAASMIFLSADCMMVKPNSYMMCHGYRGGYCGKMNELEASSDFHQDYWKGVLGDVYEHFLTPAELNKMFDGKDYYFDADEILKRLRKMQKNVKKRVENKAKL